MNCSSRDPGTLPERWSKQNDPRIELDIAYTTVRSHLDRILSRTGVSRQAELARLAANVASPSGLIATGR
jgi:hypothetical protein